jgi:diadenosine tetraphosphate (Ap4A) HIT family hydrolase
MTENPSCYYCRRQQSAVDPPPGGWLIDNADWLAGHGPAHMCLAGSLRIESRRHFTDFAEMTDAEAASFGRLLATLYRAARPATGAERIHLVATMDFQPHFHAWLYPRLPTESRRGTTFLNQDMSCDQAAAEAAAARIRDGLDGGLLDGSTDD